MISYAQNHEDVLLRRLFADQAEGFYVDVGANDPVHLSVTKHFSRSGWRGLNIEPAPGPYSRLCADRSRDVNLNVGVAAEAGALTFYECPGNDALSTFSADQAEEYRQAGLDIQSRTVPVRTLGEICREHLSGPVDFLSIDVEGFEREVLRGAELAQWRPRVILIEATKPSTDLPTHEQWEPLVLAAGYVFAYFDGLNRFYVRDDATALIERFRVPLNITDHFEPYEMVRLREQLEAKDAALHSACADSRNLTTQLEAKHAALQTAVASWSALEADLQAKDSALRAKDRDLKSKDAALQSLHQQAKLLRESLETTTASAERSEAEQVFRQARLDQLQKQLQRKDATLAQLRSMLKSRDAQLQDKHQALHAALRQSHTLQEQLRTKEAFLQAQNREFQAALEEIQRLLRRPLWERIRNAA
jgi:FkbM family methyltransferase